MARKDSKLRTISEILLSRQDEILKDWLENIRSLAGAGAAHQMTDEQMGVQPTELFSAQSKTFRAEKYLDINAHEYACCIGSAIS